MSAQLDQVALAVRLRRLRTQLAERVLMQRRLEVQEALGELDSALAMRRAWEDAELRFQAWLGGASTQRHRWTEVVDARHRDFRQGCSEARRYVEWWEAQVAKAREAEDRARREWMVERSRLDALSRRHALEARREAARRDEAVFEEQADAAGTRRTARQR